MQPSAPPCSTELSCTLAPAPSTIGPKSARSTTPYQTEASASTVTSPTSVAVGAIHADGWTFGLAPSNENSGMTVTVGRRRPEADQLVPAVTSRASAMSPILR